MVNKVILVGNVGKDPEVRYLENGVAVAQFTLATSEVYKDKSGNRATRTEWHNIVAWRNLAEIVEKYVKKGNPLYIEGKITSRSYDAKDGSKRYVTEIVANELKMLGSKPGAGGGHEQATPPVQEEHFNASASSDSEPAELNDLPF
jgi:single-strand DNA-binding protein